METPIGRIRALPYQDVEHVQVTIGADATTLHTPETAPPAAGTSAWNRFRGTAAATDESEAVAHVTVDVGGDSKLRVVITRGSLDRLGIEPSREVVATFKATAARATPA